MHILKILSRNIRNGSRTRSPEDSVKVPEGFRGVLHHDIELCTGCRTCAYVCSPSAITFDNPDGKFTAWKYSADLCTFCGRCVDFCPTHALSLTEDIPPLANDLSKYLEHRVYYQACTRCGTPVIRMPLPVMEKLYGKPLPEDITDLQGLCEKCRRKAISRRMKEAMTGKGKDTLQ